jgi:hypothetical protein
MPKLGAPQPGTERPLGSARTLSTTAKTKFIQKSQKSLNKLYDQFTDPRGSHLLSSSAELVELVVVVAVGSAEFDGKAAEDVQSTRVRAAQMAIQPARGTEMSSASRASMGVYSRLKSRDE